MATALEKLGNANRYSDTGSATKTETKTAAVQAPKPVVPKPVPIQDAKLDVQASGAKAAQDAAAAAAKVAAAQKQAQLSAYQKAAKAMRDSFIYGSDAQGLKREGAYIHALTNNPKLAKQMALADQIRQRQRGSQYDTLAKQHLSGFVNDLRKLGVTTGPDGSFDINKALTNGILSLQDLHYLVNKYAYANPAFTNQINEEYARELAEANKKKKKGAAGEALSVGSKVLGALATPFTSKFSPLSLFGQGAKYPKALYHSARNTMFTRNYDKAIYPNLDRIWAALTPQQRASEANWLGVGPNDPNAYSDPVQSRAYGQAVKNLMYNGATLSNGQHIDANGVIRQVLGRWAWDDDISHTVEHVAGLSGGGVGAFENPVVQGFFDPSNVPGMFITPFKDLKEIASSEKAATYLKTASKLSSAISSANLPLGRLAETLRNPVRRVAEDIIRHSDNLAVVRRILKGADPKLIEQVADITKPLGHGAKRGVGATASRETAMVERLLRKELGKSWQPAFKVLTGGIKTPGALRRVLEQAAEKGTLGKGLAGGLLHSADNGVLGKIGHGMFEPRAPGQIAIRRGGIYRQKAIAAFAHSLGADSNVAASLGRDVFHAAEGDTKVLHASVVTLISDLAKREGLNEKQTNQLLREYERQGKKFEEAQRGHFSAEGKRKPQVQEQLQRNVFLPNASDIRRTIKEMQQGSFRPGHGLSASRAHGVGEKVRKAENYWKGAIVTAAGLPVSYAAGKVGSALGTIAGVPKALAGVIKHEPGESAKAILRGAEGDMKRVRAGFKAYGLSAGAVAGGAKYIFKIPGGQEAVLTEALAHGGRGVGMHLVDRLPFGLGDKIRFRGLSPEEVGWAKREIESQASSIRMSLFHDAWSYAKGPKIATGDSVMFKAGSKDYFRSLTHALNNQVSDDNHVVSEMLKDASRGAEKEATDKGLVTWLKESAEGRAYMQNYRQAAGDLGKGLTEEKVVKQARAFLDPLIQDPRIIEARMNGIVEESLLRKIYKENPALLPAQIHGAEQEFIRTAKDAVGKYVFEKPHFRSRIEFFKNEFVDRYRGLLADGVPPREAARIAGNRAEEFTNDSFMRVDRHSPFSHTADLYSPFIGAKMQSIGKMVRLAWNDPLRTAKIARVGAEAFNLGKSYGMFKKDPYGQWVLTVPGSSQLSHALGAGFRPFNDALSSLTPLSEGPFGVGAIPTLGGAATAFGLAPYALQKLFPEQFKAITNNKFASQMLFPFGNNGMISNSALRNLGIYLFHGTPPWEFAAKDDIQNSINRTGQDVLAALIHDWMLKNNATDAPPDDVMAQLVKQAQGQLHGIYLVKAILSATLPGSLTMQEPTKDLFYAVRNAYKLPDGGYNYTKFLTEHPEFQPYVDEFSANSFDFAGYGDYWTQPGTPSTAMTAAQLAMKKLGTKEFSLEQFAKTITQARNFNAAMLKWNQIQNNPDRRDFYEVQDAFLKKNPEFAAALGRDNAMRAEYWRIKNAPYPEDQGTELNAWRRKYNVSANQERKLARSFALDYGTPNPFAQARNLADLMDGYRSANARKGDTVAAQVAYSKGLSAAEAYKFLSHLQATAPTHKQYLAYSGPLHAITAAHPELFNRPKSVFTTYRENELAAKFKLMTADEVHATWDKESTPIFNQIAALKDQKDAALKAKNWTLYYALKSKVGNLEDTLTAMKNAMYVHHLNIDATYNYLDEGIWGNITPSLLKQMQGKYENFLHIAPEETQWAKMSDAARKDYLNEMKSKVDKYYHWGWLTNFQQDLMKGAYGLDMVRKWSNMTAADYKRISGHSGVIDGSKAELTWAKAMFQRYNRRGGARPPADYAAYLKIDRTNSSLRVAFLNAHPDVAAYVHKGPMANMPPVIRNMVANIMVKYGKWSGSEMSIQQLTDLSWAEQQLQVYSKRGSLTKPSSLDLWLKMPSGPSKAAYLAQHPEIGAWLSAGPMANMPSNVKSVVRDIMTAYGVWTEQQDPLGGLLNQYSQLPPSAKEAFLNAHPEIIAYWRALRPANQRAVFDTAQTYFGITDPTAKKEFLDAHPELKNYFVDERQRRYEDFLNRVSFYLRQNPEIITGYVKEQTAILKMLLEKFGQDRALTKETFISGSTKAYKSRRAA